VWQRPLDALQGKPLCEPGAQIEVVVNKETDETQMWRMSADRHSCQKYFVPHELADILDSVSGDATQVKMLSWAFPAIIKLVALQARIKKDAAKHGIPNVTTIVDYAVNFAIPFTSEQQVELVKPFIFNIRKALAAKQKPTKVTKTAAFSTGDEVTWLLEPGADRRAQGFIRSIGGRQRLVTLMVAGAHARALQPSYADEWQENNPGLPIEKLVIQIRYQVSEWKETRDPVVVAETAIFDGVTDGTDG